MKIQDKQNYDYLKIKILSIEYCSLKLSTLSVKYNKIGCIEYQKKIVAILQGDFSMRVKSLND